MAQKLKAEYSKACLTLSLMVWNFPERALKITLLLTPLLSSDSAKLMTAFCSEKINLFDSIFNSSLNY